MARGDENDRGKGPHRVVSNNSLSADDHSWAPQRIPRHHEVTISHTHRQRQSVMHALSESRNQITGSTQIQELGCQSVKRGDALLRATQDKPTTRVERETRS